MPLPSPVRPDAEYREAHEIATRTGGYPEELSEDLRLLADVHVCCAYIASRVSEQFETLDTFGARKIKDLPSSLTAHMRGLGRILKAQKGEGRDRQAWVWGPELVKNLLEASDDPASLDDAVDWVTGLLAEANSDKK